MSLCKVCFQLLYFTNVGLVQCKDHFLPRCFFSSPKCGSTISWVLLLSGTMYASFFLSWVQVMEYQTVWEENSKFSSPRTHNIWYCQENLHVFIYIFFFYNNYVGQQIHRCACWLLNNHQDSPQLVCCIIFAWIKLSMKRLSIQTGTVAGNWSEAWTSVP